MTRGAPFGGGTCARRLMDRDWSAHALGPPARWPARLSTALQLCLDAPTPHALVWGPHRFLFYNEACAPLLGESHPEALACELAVAWPRLVAGGLGSALDDVETRARSTCVKVPPAGGEDDPPLVVALTPIRQGRRVAGALLALQPWRSDPGETARRADEERFLRMADDAPATLWLTDAQDRCTFLSAGWYEFTGRSTAGERSLDWTACVHPDDRAAAESAFHEASRRRVAFSVDYRLRRGDGEYRWVISRGRPRLDADGTWLGYVGSVIDVHERKLAEQALETELEDMQRLQATSTRLVSQGAADLHLEIVDAAVAIAHADFGCLQLLDAHSGDLVMLATRGVSEDVGRHFLRVRASDATICAAALARGVRVIEPDFELAALDTEPATRDVLRSAGIRAGQSTPLVTRAGELIGMLSTHWARPREPAPRELRLMDLLARQAADLLERQRRERELGRAVERFKLLADAAPVMLWLSDDAGQVTFVSRGWTEFTGRGPGTSLGETWLDAVHPDDRERVRSEYAVAHGSGRPFSLAHRLRRADGVYRRVVAHARPRPEEPEEEGVARGYVGAIVDIDEEMRTQAVLAGQKRALELALAGAETAEVLDVLVRTAAAETGPGAALAILRSEEDAPPACSALAEELRRAVERAADAAHATAGVGAARWAALRAELAREGLEAGRWKPLVAADGTRLGVLALLHREGREPSAQDHAVAELLHATGAIVLEHARIQRSLARANRLKDEFLATLSHELRTPLHAITGWAEILGRQPLARDVAHGVEVIGRNAGALAQLIADLLDMSRIMTGKLRLAVGPVDLAAVIGDAVESVRLPAEARGIRIDTRIQPLAEPLPGDRGRLQQVVWNLLSNALKFTQPGGRVEVALERAPAHATLTVSDDGVGIRPEFLPYLFDRFRQADASAARGHGGLGIGLALVKELVELHGGRVSAESAGAGRGATFRIELPLRGSVPGPTCEPALAPRPAALASRAGPGLSGLSILLVDDEPDALETVAWLLSERGARVTTAGSAEACLAELERRGFDLLVADIAMPGVDGYELLTRLRTRGHALPAVALTAFARAEDRARALAAGFAEHVAKPVDTATLLEVVARHASGTADAN